ncbi:MAG: hypothetical protein LBR10_12210 [Prevotellaceae bacterium]|nr:hypothetical protein [Prevotellaceae bacterium]
MERSATYGQVYVLYLPSPLFGVAGRYAEAKSRLPACKPACNKVLAGTKDFKVLKVLKVLSTREKRRPALLQAGLQAGSLLLASA